MAWKTVHYLYCDHPDCDGTEPFTIAPGPSVPRSRQWERAKAEGWTRKDGKHYCAECSGNLPGREQP